MGRNRVKILRVGSSQHFEEVCAKTRPNHLYSAHQVGEKLQRVVIQLIKRQPADKLSALTQPLAGNRCFTKAGGGGDQGRLLGYCSRRERTTSPIRGVGSWSLVGIIESNMALSL